MQIGISTACFYPEALENGFEKLLNCGFRFFEVFVNTFSELHHPYLDQLKIQAESRGAKILSLHPFTSGYESFLLFSAYERRFEDSMEFYRQYFEAAAFLGAEILVLHGQRKERAGDIPEEIYFERYHRLFELGKTYGVTLAQENVNAFCSENPEFLHRMRSYLHEDCAFVLDLKQAVRSNHDPFETCAQMGEQLVHIHLNDHKPGKDCLLPGQGITDYGRLMRQLKRQNYKGNLIIEVYRKNFGSRQDLIEAKRKAETIQKYFYTISS